MPEVGLAVIGLGRMGRVHLEALASVPGATLVSVAEPRPEAVHSADKFLGRATVYQQAEDALNHEGVHACLIVTPTDAHGDSVSMALAAGKHVLCEKPLSLDPSEADQLGRQAEASGLLLQVGFWRRYCAPLIKSRELIQEGLIGELIALRCVQWDVLCPPPEWCDPAKSGGIFIDMAVHEFDQVEWMLGERATSIRALPRNRVEQGLARVQDLDNAMAVLEFPSGRQATIDLSRNGRYADDLRLEALGSDGAVFVDTWPQARVRLGTRSGLETVWKTAGDTFLEGITTEQSAFVNAVNGDTGPMPPTAADSNRAVYLGRMATLSASNGEAVQLSRNLAIPG